MNYPPDPLWSLQCDEHGNYLVDPNGNQVACIYELAVGAMLLNILNGPTSDMVEAGERASYSPEEAKAVYCAMIAAALAYSPPIEKPVALWRVDVIQLPQFARPSHK